MATRFANRHDAGRRLAGRLTRLLGPPVAGDVVVLALAPGGVPVAAEVAHALDAPLDVLVTRTVAAPGNGTVLGAIAFDEPPLLDRRLAHDLGVTTDDLAAEVDRQRAELHHRERQYRHSRPPLSPTGRTVVLVADGLPGGPTARAAVHALNHQQPARLIVAAPVCDGRLAAELRRDADVVCLHQETYLHAVGPWYQDFRDVAEREITDVLDQRAATP